MPVANALFRSHSDIVHHEHAALLSELAELETALDELVCYSEVFTNLAATERVARAGRHLAHVLPEHFENEEVTVLAELVRLNPELADFAAEMTRQHRDLRQKLTDFCLLIAEVEDSVDLEQTVCAVKECGREFVRALGTHMAAEERKFQLARA